MNLGDILQGLGRSQAITNTMGSLQALQKEQQAIRMGEQEMNLKEQAGNIQKQQFAMNKESHEIELKKANYQLAEAKALQEDQDRPIFMTRYATHPMFNEMRELALKEGILKNVGGVEYAKKRDWLNFQKSLKGRDEDLLNLDMGHLQKIDAQVQQINQALLKEKNPDKKAELEAGRAQLLAQEEGLTKSIVFRDAKIREGIAIAQGKAQAKAQYGAHDVDNEYKDFMRTQLSQGMTKEEALENWQKRQTDLAEKKREIIVQNPSEKSKNDTQIVENALTEKLGRVPTAEELKNELITFRGQVSTEQFKNRYPSYQQGQGMPPGIVFDRRTGKYSDPSLVDPVTNKPKEFTREELVEEFGEGAVLSADKKALAEITKRSELIKTFTNRIDANSKIVMEQAKKLGNQDSKLLNIPINRIKRYIGAGEWNAFNLALTSLSNEISKVESGSIGIAGASVDQMKVMASIHDPNLSMNDLKKVVDVGIELSNTSKDALEKQRNEIIGRFTSEKPKEVESKKEQSDMDQFWRK